MIIFLTSALTGLDATQGQVGRCKRKAREGC